MRTTSRAKWAFATSALMAVYWWTSISVEVYESVVAGAIYELLWLPMLILIFVMPLISLIAWAKEKFSPTSYYFFSFMLSTSTLVGMFLFG